MITSRKTLLSLIEVILLTNLLLKASTLELPDYEVQFVEHKHKYTVNITCLQKNSKEKRAIEGGTEKLDNASVVTPFQQNTEATGFSYKSNKVNYNSINELKDKRPLKKEKISHIKPNHSNSLARTKLHIDVYCDYFNLSANNFTDNTDNSSFLYLWITSSGILEIDPLWSQAELPLLRIDIKSNAGLVFSQNCSWLPRTISYFDLSYTPLQNLSLTECPSTLKSLSLKGASLSNLSLCLPYVNVIDASFNSLKEVSSDCVEGQFNGAKTLVLENNQLTDWSPCNWPNLVSLDIHVNELQMLDLLSCPLHSLEVIDASYNLLHIPPLKYPHKLTKVDLSHNRLNSTTRFNRAVVEINLSHNSLVSIAKGTFRAASDLLSLDLSNNKLTVIHGHDFAGLWSLRSLDLSHNELTHIRPEAFHHMKYISTLQIESNKLQTLHPAVLTHLEGAATHVSASANPWHCDCRLMAALKVATQPDCAALKCPQKANLLSCAPGGDVRVRMDAAQVVRSCLSNADERAGEQPRRPLIGVDDSDEDLSEEKTEERNSGLTWRVTVLPLVLLLVATPFVAFGVRKLYLNRKTISHRLNCMGRGSACGPSGGAITATTFCDSDSETEM